MQPVSLETLVAERELLDLLARFDDTAIRTDLESFRSLWTEDSVWEIGAPIPMRAEGRDAIVQALASLQKNNLFFFRLTARPVMTIEGDRALMRSPTVELAARVGHQAYAPTWRSIRTKQCDPRIRGAFAIDTTNICGWTLKRNSMDKRFRGLQAVPQ